MNVTEFTNETLSIYHYLSLTGVFNAFVNDLKNSNN